MKVVSKPDEVSAPDPDLLIRQADRVSAVERTGLLDAPAEAGFDRLTRLAARLLAVPVSFISLVDEYSDFYMSHCGFDEPLATTRRLKGRTFCHHAIASREPLLIEDTLAHPVFRDVPTVYSMGVRAYAGVPLFDDRGHALGSFCAIDVVPRSWSASDVEILTELARSAEREIRLRLTLDESDRHLLEAQKAMRSLEETLAVVAHDLRTPLNVLALALTVLEADISREMRLSTTKRMTRAVESSVQLVEDLLQRSRLDHGQVKVTTLDVVQVLEEAAAMLRPLAQRQGAALVTQSAPDLGKFVADYQLLLRALSNLVVNALKFSPAQCTVRMSAEREQDFIRYSVADEGPGITPENLARLFERFWQADKRDERGLGLGLSITQSIMAAHGGELTAVSTVGVGSVFSLKLPLVAGGAA